MSGNIIGRVKSSDDERATRAVTVIYGNVGGWPGIGDKVLLLQTSDFKYLSDLNVLLTEITEDKFNKMNAIEEKVPARSGLTPPCAERPSAQ